MEKEVTCKFVKRRRRYEFGKME